MPVLHWGRCLGKWPKAGSLLAPLLCVLGVHKLPHLQVRVQGLQDKGSPHQKRGLLTMGFAIQGANSWRGTWFCCFHSVTKSSLHGLQHGQFPLSFTISWSLLKFRSTESVMLFNHLILCHTLLFLPSIFPSIWIFSNESALPIRWPKYWSFSFSISPSNECFCSVAQSCLTLPDTMDCSSPGFPVLHYLPEFAQTHVHWVDDAIQPSHPLSPPSSPALDISQHQGLFQWVSSFH